MPLAMFVCWRESIKGPQDDEETAALHIGGAETAEPAQPREERAQGDLHVHK